MKKFTLFSFVFILSLILLGSFNVKPASAYDLGCTLLGPYNIFTGKLCPGAQANSSSLSASAINSISRITPIIATPIRTPIIVSTPTTPTYNGSVAVSLDSSTPIAGTITPEQTNVMFAKIKLTATGGDVNAQWFSVVSNSANSINSLSNIKIFNGATLLGTAPKLLPLQSAVGGYVNVPESTPVVITNGNSVVLTIVADVSSSASGVLNLGIGGGGGNYTAMTPNYSIYGNSMTVGISGTTTPTITVVSPGVGEQWAQGTTHTINWKDNFIPNTDSCGINCHISPLPPQYYNIILTDTSSVPRTIASSVSGSSYNWKIPYCTVANPCNSNMYEARPLSGSYTISVCPAGSGAVCGISKSFNIISGTITVPTITVTSPNGGELLAVGSSYPINWMAASAGRYYIYLLSQNSSGNWVATDGIGSSINNSFTFFPSTSQVGLKKIRISNNPNEVSGLCLDPIIYNPNSNCQINSPSPTFVFDDSNAPFNIVSVTTPTQTSGPIVITNVKFSPESPKVNDLITSYITIKNSSYVNVTTPFRVDVEGTDVTVASLAAGAQTTVTVPNAFSFASPGTYSIPALIISSDNNSYGIYYSKLTFTSSTITGCTSTTGFSSTTGQSCAPIKVCPAWGCDGPKPVKPILPIGCTTTVGYSSTTGQICLGTPIAIPIPTPTNPVPGCTSTTGFSSTTGVSCAPIKVCPAWGCDGPKPITPIIPISTLPAGCTTTVGFSSTTGVACSGTTTVTTTRPIANPVLPVSKVLGCASTIGYSSVSGVSCAVK